ncbi:11515_t:CDS:2 [Diversispora eburnea]|uniref:Small ribosomal subunit protein mS23 n=1 Tax=Diversispora eburnea TaxID=1213867 RepID=A0A9N9APL8_9GLOM|nr:11515_t:CDS:2 [Diversispora eburnea]
MYRGSPTKLHNHVSRLLKGGIYKTPPTWYPVMKLYPPGPSILRSPLQFVDPLLTDNNKRKDDTSKNLKTKIPRPPKIEFPEDRLRKRFYKDHPYELLKPQTLLENKFSNRENWESLLGNKHPSQVTGESVIKYQLHLISKGMSEREAYAKACNEFYEIRARQEVAERVAEEQALAFGAKRNLSQVEKALWLEKENIKKCPPQITQMSRPAS